MPPLSSIISPHWKPEHPPPWTKTRRPLPVFPSSVSSSLIFEAAAVDTFTIISVLLRIDGLEPLKSISGRSRTRQVRPQLWPVLRADSCSTSSWRLLPWASMVTMAGKSFTVRCHIASGVPNSINETPSTLGNGPGVELSRATDRVEVHGAGFLEGRERFRPHSALRR